jgi:hypothetical protein
MEGASRFEYDLANGLDGYLAIEQWKLSLTVTFPEMIHIRSI